MYNCSAATSYGMKKRIIARLDIKGPNVIKGIQLECLRVMGKPDDLAQEYYQQGADELIYLDTVASLYRRDNLLNIVKQASENIFIPFIAGGGVRNINDIRSLLSAGAEKVAVNTAATKNPELIRQAAKIFGSQCIVLSIEAKQVAPGRWEAYVDNGRQRTGLDVIKWAKQGEKLGAGEILLTAVDRDGMENGLDNELIKKVTEAVSIPVIASGGAGSPQDVVECVKKTNVDAVAVGSILHYRKFGMADIKSELKKEKIAVRQTVNFSTKQNKTGQKYDIKNYNKYTMRHLTGVTGLAANKIRTEDAPARFKEEYPKGSADLGVIDYKINNVRSVLRAFQKLGKKVAIVETPEEFDEVKTLVLPGVGAFGEGMKALKKAGLIESIKRQVMRGKPILGLCLGMQMLFFESEEFGRNKGLDLIEGNVVSFKPVNKIKLPDYKLPHIGWTKISAVRRNKTTLLSGIKTPADVYFVHSFFSQPKDRSIILANAEYGGQKFCAVVQKENIMGTQFHPEKSGEVGLGILKQFCKISNI